MVIPRVEVDHWIDLESEMSAHLTRVAQAIGRAQHSAFHAERIGLAIAGFDVPHVHLHTFTTSGPTDFAHLGGSPASDEELEEAARRLRSALVEQGHDDPVEAALLASAR